MGRHDRRAVRVKRGLAATAAACVLVVACSDPDIRIEESTPIVGDQPAGGDTPDPPDENATTAPADTGTPTTGTPSTGTPSTGTPSTVPPTDSGTTAESTTTAPTAGREPELGVGDELFPELGSSDLDVQSYVVRLDASEPTGELAGSVEITTLVERDVAAIAIDVDGPSIERVEVDGVDTEYVVEDQELIVDTSAEQVADGEAVIVIDYRITPVQGRPSSVGLPLGWIVAGDGAYVLNQPDGASSWLPSNDHPSDRASWRFEIDAQAGHVVSANGELVEQPDDDAAGTWIWEQSVSMPTYLVHLVVGDYDLIQGDTVEGVGGADIPLTHLVPSGTADDFADAIAGVPTRIAFFEERFGPYPLDRYGLAFVEELSGLAMETQGRSLFGARDFAGRGDGFVQELLLAHELAHQWFGNAVTPAAWEDLWLNESLTTYAQWLWLDEVGRQPLDSWAQRMLGERQTDSFDATGDPILSNLFGFERYDGGAVVVHALRLEIGDDAFFDLMARWIGENIETSRTTADFIALAESVADVELDSFFDSWLFAVELPAEYPGE